MAANKEQIIIVGAGLFGSIAATLARARGREVVLIDDKAEYSASRASGCVLAPSWLSNLDREQVHTALDVLHEFYEVQPIVFHTNLLKKFSADRVDLDKILLEPDVLGRVVKVGNGFAETSSKRFEGRILVAAGVGCASLLGDRIPRVRGLWGASLRVPGRLTEPKIHVYAPYRQAVAFQLGPNKVWFGDGTALIDKTWETTHAARIEATLQRCADFMKLEGALGSKVEIRVGARPYVEDHKAGYFEKIHPRTWVSTGGAKNGTVLAAWQAHQFITSCK